jgi:hypothetical protein
MRRWIVIGLGAASVTALGVGLALQGCAGVDCSHDPTCSGANAGGDDGAASKADGASPGDGSADAIADRSIAPDAAADTPEGATPGDGGCTAPASLLCNGTCVDPTQAAVCASCGSACPAPPSGHGQAACGDAGCSLSCAAGYHACGGDCQSDGDTPSNDPCVISETFGVFVSPAGNDATGAGTQANPYATLGKGIDAAKASGKRVYACGSAGNYTENLVVGTSRDGVSVYGGLDCSNAAAWTYSASKIATVTPASGLALSIAGLSMGATFTDMAFQAPDAPATAPSSGAGASSIAVVVNAASGVVFNRGTIAAGRGQPGAAGTLSAYNFPSASSLHGQAGNDSAGGVSVYASCPNVTSGPASTGGQGGSPPSGSGAAGQPNLDDAGAGGVGGDGGASCVNGNDGLGGANGTNGVGASVPGTLSNTTWQPSAGSSGLPGAPGQGGSGGGASAFGGGGGGGAGGCGGEGGGAGGGGGASIGLLAVGSAGLTINGVTIAAGAGGLGGSGASGQPGEAGGIRGAPGANGGCSGGNGGAGGNGGGGGGGAGGPSIGVLYTGAMPTLDVATTAGFQAGTPGSGGMGGALGADGGLAGTNNGVGGQALSGILVASP